MNFDDMSSDEDNCNTPKRKVNPREYHQKMKAYETERPEGIDEKTWEATDPVKLRKDLRLIVREMNLNNKLDWKNSYETTSEQVWEIASRIAETCTAIDKLFFGPTKCLARGFEALMAVADKYNDMRANDMRVAWVDEYSNMVPLEFNLAHELQNKEGEVAWKNYGEQNKPFYKWKFEIKGDGSGTASRPNELFRIFFYRALVALAHDNLDPYEFDKYIKDAMDYGWPKFIDNHEMSGEFDSDADLLKATLPPGYEEAHKRVMEAEDDMDWYHLEGRFIEYPERPGVDTRFDSCPERFIEWNVLGLPNDTDSDEDHIEWVVEKDGPKPAKPKRGRGHGQPEEECVIM